MGPRGGRAFYKGRTGQIIRQGHSDQRTGLAELETDLPTSRPPRPLHPEEAPSPLGCPPGAPRAVAGEEGKQAHSAQASAFTVGPDQVAGLGKGTSRGTEPYAVAAHLPQPWVYPGSRLPRRCRNPTSGVPFQEKAAGAASSLTERAVF